jgi:hypothetical protein
MTPTSADRMMAFAFLAVTVGLMVLLSLLI